MCTLADSMTDAFGVMEQRMIHPQTGLPLNYTGLGGCVSLPTEEDLREGRPSHLGWNSPMEDGAFYGGLYLDGLCNRARFSDDARALTAAARTARGLAALSALGADGFVARGFVGASRSHFRCGSQDQTFPWLYGLWRFIRSGIGSQSAAICRDAVLRGLAEMEEEPELRTLYTRILARDAQAAWTHVGRYRGYQEASAPPFRDDWRAMNALWEEQKCVADAHRIAWAQMPIWFSRCPRFPYENAYVREPLHAALIYALGLPWLGDTRGLGQVLTMLTVLPWDRLYTATFLTALTVYGQLAADECQPI